LPGEEVVLNSALGMYTIYLNQMSWEYLLKDQGGCSVRQLYMFIRMLYYCRCIWNYEFIHSLKLYTDDM